MVSHPLRRISRLIADVGNDCQKEIVMKNSKTLLLEYLDSVRDPERAASLFAKDGVFELPFLRSLGVEPRYTGRSEITALSASMMTIPRRAAISAIRR
jgi:hypothetical protein